MPSRWMQKNMKLKHEEHKKRIMEARSSIDKNPPPAMPMSMRREIERRRVQNLIEFDNRLLLDRLGEAMNKKNIDNELKTKPFTSFIEMQRKRELKKITTENQLLLQRIQTTVPSYHVEEWERDAKKRVEYLRNMTEFPDYFVPPGTRSLKSSHNIDSRSGHITLHREAGGSMGHPPPPQIMNSTSPPVKRPPNSKTLTLPPI